MKELLIWSLAAAIGGQNVMPSDAQLEVLDTVQGTSFSAIDSAVEVLKQRKLDLSNFRITVVGEAKSVIVVFNVAGAETGLQEQIAVSSGIQLSVAEIANLSKTSGSKVLDTIHGRSYYAIAAAMAPFHKRGLDLAFYTISVMREGNSLYVSFVDKEATQRKVRGNPGKRPGFEVELATHDLHVVRSSFIR